MSDSIVIKAGIGRDHVEKFEQELDKVIVYLKDKSGKVSKIEVPQSIIDWVKNFIDDLPVGEKIKSSELYQYFIGDFNLKSPIAEKHIRIIEKTMSYHGYPELRIAQLVEDLKNNNEFGLMTYEEFIGTRKKRNTLYFKVWSAIRYWQNQGNIHYTLRGSITRII